MQTKFVYSRQGLSILELALAVTTVLQLQAQLCESEPAMLTLQLLQVFQLINQEQGCQM